jgi:RNA polymerase sigma-70 factor (ECF subfamily)
MPLPLSAALEGSQEAFAGLVRAHESMVYGIAVNFLRDRNRAEDVAQEVFLELYRNLRRIENEKHLAYWLRQVATRKCIDLARREKLRRGPSLEDVAEPAARDRAQTAVENEALKKLVASLPERLRAVVVLRYQEDLDPADIAGMLGMKTQSVKSLLHRGLELLRAKMRRQAEARS